MMEVYWIYQLKEWEKIYEKLFGGFEDLKFNSSRR